MSRVCVSTAAGLSGLLLTNAEKHDQYLIKKKKKIYQRYFIGYVKLKVVTNSWICYDTDWHSLKLCWW